MTFCLTVVYPELMKTTEDVERLLVDVGAVKVGDHRLRRSSEELVSESLPRMKSSAKDVDDDDDDDWN